MLTQPYVLCSLGSQPNVDYTLHSLLIITLLVFLLFFFALLSTLSRNNFMGAKSLV